MTDDYPLVSAIMLAGKTPLADLMRCIECFHAQTYPSKELIIINTGQDIPEGSNTIIQSERAPAGILRNKAIAASNGQILAQFDADYWHAPNRLAAQISTMANKQAHISVLASTLYYSFISGRARLNCNQQNAVLNTMVWVKSDINYPPIEHGEEYIMFSSMCQSGMRPIAIDQPELCCKMILTNNNRQIRPANVDLSDQQFEIVQKIVNHDSENHTPDSLD